MDINDRSLPAEHLDIIEKSSTTGKHGVVTLTAWLQKVDVEDADLDKLSLNVLSMVRLMIACRQVLF